LQQRHRAGTENPGRRIKEDSKMKTLRLGILSLLVPLALSIGVGAVWSQERSKTKASMRGIFVTVTKAYLYSLDAKAFEDPANNAEITSMLQALAANASDLELHGGGLNPSFEYMRRSLAQDAVEALDRFQEGQYMGARFVLSKITENCVTCHSKLPIRGKFDPGANFVDQAKIKKLKPLERAELDIATRQFDTALTTYEKIFADPETSAETLALAGAWEKYIRLCVGVFDNTARPIAALQKFVQRPDVSASQKKLVSGWIDQLRKLDLDSAVGHELEVSRRMLKHAEDNIRFASDRSQMVDYIAVATILNRFLATNPKGNLAVAEAFYILGVAEARIQRSYWISETGILLAQAIREAPKSEIAKKAYAFLEEYTISSHLATTSRDVSPELKANLEDLRKLMGQ
jgi:hypothetical protein